MRNCCNRQARSVRSASYTVRSSVQGGDAMSVAETEPTAGAQAEQGKAEVFANLGSSGQSGSAKRTSFFDLHATEVVPVVDAEQYCEYPESILNSDVDLHAFHEGT